MKIPNEYNVVSIKYSGDFVNQIQPPTKDSIIVNTGLDEILPDNLFIKNIIKKPKPTNIKNQNNLFQNNDIPVLDELFFQNTSDLMLFLDPFGKIIKINKAGLFYSGFSEIDVVGKLFWLLPNVFSKVRIPKYLKVFKDALSGKITRDFISSLDDILGKSHVMKFLVIPIKDKKKVKYILVIGCDITEQQKLTVKYDLISEYTGDLVMTTTVSKNPRISYVNPSYEVNLGYKPQELYGELLFNFIHPNDKKKVKRLFKKYNENIDKNQFSDSIKCRIIDKSGKYHYLEKTINLMGDELLIVTKDITKQNLIERKIKEQNIKLKKLDELKTIFLNITSHELRTPLASIKGYVQMLIKGIMGNITEEQLNSLDVVLRNTNRLDKLIQDILDVSRLESGIMKFIPEKTDIVKLIDQTVEMKKSFAQEKNIKISIEIENQIPLLYVDREKIKQVILNLIDNSIKFSKVGSIVNIRVKGQKDYFLFEVHDQGPGLSQSELRKVFDLFYQVEYGMDRKFGGTGLGLPISHGIVNAHGGRIWVKSKEGKGCVFYFSLPVALGQNFDRTI